jgi:hypothetical protein
MKKIFTLVIALFSISAVFAQYGRSDDRFQRGDDQPSFQRGYDQPTYQRDYGYNRGYEDHGNRGLHRMVEQINWKYEARMNGVRNNPYMRMWEKDRVLENLERQRRAEIRDVFARCNFHDRDDAWRRY